MEDFHPFMLKKLLGLSDEASDGALEDVRPVDIAMRMSMPFEAALRHFRPPPSAVPAVGGPNRRNPFSVIAPRPTESGETPEDSAQCVAAYRAFLYTRERLRGIWRPFPGDYARIFSLVPFERSRLRIVLYEAMLEDFRGVPAEAVPHLRPPKAPAADDDAANDADGGKGDGDDALSAPGGGCPRAQSRLIEEFERKHHNALQRYERRKEFEVELKSAAVAAGFEDKIRSGPLESIRSIIPGPTRRSYPPLDPSSLDSLFSHMHFAASERRFEDAAGHVATIVELLRALPTARARAVALGGLERKMGMRRLSFLFAQYHLHFMKPSAVAERVLAASDVISLSSAAGALCSKDMDSAIELYALARSRSADTQAMTHPNDVLRWGRAYLARHPMLSSFVYTMTKRAMASYPPGTKAFDVGRLQSLLYMCAIHTDTSHRASTNTYITARTKVLPRARASMVRHWGSGVSRMQSYSAFLRRFGPSLAADLRALPPLLGAPEPLEGTIEQHAKMLHRERSGIVVLDASYAARFTISPRRELRAILAHAEAEAVRCGGEAPALRSLRCVLPWSVLFEMDAGAGSSSSYSLSRGRVHRALSKLGTTTFTLTPPVDASCAAMTPLCHLYGRSSLGVADRHVANIALAFDLYARSLLRPIARHTVPAAPRQSEKVAATCAAAKHLPFRGGGGANAAGEDEGEYVFREDDDTSPASSGRAAGGDGGGVSGGGADAADQDDDDDDDGLVEGPAAFRPWNLFSYNYFMHVRRCLESAGPKVDCHIGENPFDDPVRSFRFDGLPTGHVIVATLDVELAAYCRDLGLVVYPPLAEDGRDAAAQEVVAREEGDLAGGGDDDHDDDEYDGAH